MLAASCARLPRMTSPTARAGWRSRSTSPATAARFGGVTAFLESCWTRSLRLTCDGVRHGRGRRGEPDPSCRADARTLARLAAQYADRGVVGFGLSNDERRAAPRRSPEPSASLAGPGLPWYRTVASCWGRGQRPRQPGSSGGRPRVTGPQRRVPGPWWRPEPCSKVARGRTSRSGCTRTPTGCRRADFSAREPSWRSGPTTPCCWVTASPPQYEMALEASTG